MSKKLTDFETLSKEHPESFVFHNYMVSNKATGEVYMLDGSQFGMVERFFFRRALNKLKKARGLL